MAPIRHNGHSSGRRDRDKVGSDRKRLKPLVERKRRARINESLQELRVLIAEGDVKMENAEVLEMTVKQVESILRDRAQEAEAVNREACERFAAGYIQCMHDVHTFVSNSSGIEPSVAAELLKHLLESIPLSSKDNLCLEVPDNMAEQLDWSMNESLYWNLESPIPSASSSDELCSDLDDADSDQSLGSLSDDSYSSSLHSSRPVWRPW